MTEETAQPAGTGEDEPSEMAALLTQMEALTTSQAALQTQLAEQATPQEEPREPPPAAPPEPVGRITRQQYDTMSTYAAQQAQRAERYQLAAQHGLQPEELDGEFASPQAMQQYAELLALRKSVRALEQSLQESLEVTPTPTVPEEGEGEVSLPEDTGGPTGTQSPEQVAVAAQYEEAKALGRTVGGRQALLQTIYGDPEKQSPIRSR